MTVAPDLLYPLRFEPIYQSRLWGGRRFADLLTAPLPDGPIGEAWLLSDRDDQQSRVADGPLAGQTLAHLLKQWPVQMLGSLAGRFRRFPLLLKFLDARDTLSVQVHPTDRQAADLDLADSGKTEAWVVLEADADSRIYAGLKVGTSVDDLRTALSGTSVVDHLASFAPHAGDGVLLPAGTVHALGGGLVVFEVQQNSDLTFRLYDWDRVDNDTGLPRALQVDRGLACTDFAAGPVLPTQQTSNELFRCEQFAMRRLRGDDRIRVGAADTPRVLVCIAGAGDLNHDDASFAMNTGDVMLLPAVVGECEFQPSPSATLLEVSLPEATTR